MSMICKQCGKTIENEGAVFCPYCGTKLANETVPEIRNEEAEKWIRKAQSVSSYPERKKILGKAIEACPGDRDIEWEMLFVGEEGPKKGRVLDFSIIKCWILELYRKPGEFSEEKRNSMRAQLFEDPKLVQCLQKFEDPKQKQQEYLLRLCREYTEIFLEGDSQVMGKLFGFSLERNKEKRLAVPAAQMIERMKADEKLTPEQREQLWKAMYQAYAVRAQGNTQYLDEQLR